jgi:lysozyme
MSSFRWLLCAGLGLILTACSPAPEPPPPAPESPPPPTPTVSVTTLHHGLDVSSHSGTVEWPTLVQAGHSFAFIKATEGIDLKDPAFDGHWRQMKAAGLVRGAYHFYVTEDDPAEQARFFIANVALESGDLAPVVDVEVIGHGTPPGLPDRLRHYLDTVESHYGVKPIIYTSANFWDQHLTADFGDYPLWIAEYEVEEPRLPAGWGAWHLWQWRGDAEVPGVEKGADLSRLNRDGAGVDLSTLLIP